MQGQEGRGRRSAALSAGAGGLEQPAHLGRSVLGAGCPIQAVPSLGRRLPHAPPTAVHSPSPCAFLGRLPETARWRSTQALSPRSPRLIASPRSHVLSVRISGLRSPAELKRTLQLQAKSPAQESGLCPPLTASRSSKRSLCLVVSVVDCTQFKGCGRTRQAEKRQCRECKAAGELLSSSSSSSQIPSLGGT